VQLRLALQHATTNADCAPEMRGLPAADRANAAAVPD
jgi:hypothetical protein